MDNYEIRLVKRSGPVVYTSRYISDYAAMRGARLMAEADDGIEIWRGMDRIYQAAATPARRTG